MVTTRSASDVAAVRAVVAAVPDPEIPVLTIDDLGILRDVRVGEAGRVEVTITPTYSGCPAMDAIRADIHGALAAEGYADVRVSIVLSPAWTTDWISDEGRQKMLAYGIAPPGRAQQPGGDPAGDGTLRAGGPISLTLSVRCPQCGSPDTRELSRFGSTSCKALWVCNACREPFDHFKPL